MKKTLAKKIGYITLALSLALSPLSSTQIAMAQSQNYKEIIQTITTDSDDITKNLVDTAKRLDNTKNSLNQVSDKKFDQLKKDLTQILDSSIQVKNELGQKEVSLLEQAKEVNKEYENSSDSIREKTDYNKKLQKDAMRMVKIQSVEVLQVAIITEFLSALMANDVYDNKTIDQAKVLTDKLQQSFPSNEKYLKEAPIDDSTTMLRREYAIQDLHKQLEQFIQNMRQIKAATPPAGSSELPQTKPETQTPPVPEVTEIPTTTPKPTPSTTPETKDEKATPTEENKEQPKETPKETEEEPKEEEPEKEEINIQDYFTKPLDQVIKEIQTKDNQKLLLGAKFQINSRTMQIANAETTETLKMDTAALISQKRTMIPLRYAGAGLGLDVSWNQKTKTVTLKDEKNTVTVPINKKQITVNKKVHKTDVKPLLKNNRTYLSISNLAIAMGLNQKENILWNPNTKEVIILRDFSK